MLEARRIDEAVATLGLDIEPALEVAAELESGNGEALGQAFLQSSAVGDDRPLYWQRLAAIRAAKERGVDDFELTAFERASRGADFAFDNDVDRRVIVSGFDPFNLDDAIEQTNPSGVVALTLRDRVTTIRGLKTQFKTTIVPVRFADFDAVYIESLLGPWIEHSDFDLMVTVSMGRNGFDLERFPALRRSADKPDNDDVLTGASLTNPLVPPDLHGPEFVEFSLPDQMSEVTGPYDVKINPTVATLERGTFDAQSLAELDGQTSVFGSGGGYLSNEISYRTLRLRDMHGCDRSIGHLHTPSIQGYDADAVEKIVEQAIAIIEAGV